MNLKDLIDSTVRGYLYRTLSECQGNIPKAAIRAGFHRKSFYRVLRRYGIITGRMKDLPGNGARHIPG